MSRPRIDTWRWNEDNKNRYGIYNANFDELGRKVHLSMIESEPWFVVKGHETIHQAEAYGAAAEFLRNKLQEVS